MKKKLKYLCTVAVARLVRFSCFDVCGGIWPFWEKSCNSLQIESPQIVREMNMRSFNKSTCPISLSRLKKEQVPYPRIIFEYKEMEAARFGFLRKLIIHGADVLSRIVSFNLLPQMIYITIEKSGNVIVSNEFASRYHSSKVAVPYREFFAELDNFVLFGDRKKLTNLVGWRCIESLDKIINYARDNVFHDIFSANDQIHPR